MGITKTVMLSCNYGPETLKAERHDGRIAFSAMNAEKELTHVFVSKREAREFAEHVLSIVEELD